MGDAKLKKTGHWNEQAPLPAPATSDRLRESQASFSAAPEGAKMQEYTGHCNRHTFASRLVVAGQNLRRLQSCSAIGR